MSVDRLISIKLPICQYVAYWELIKLIPTDPFLSVVFLLCAGASWGVPLMANQLYSSWTAERNGTRSGNHQLGTVRHSKQSGFLNGRVLCPSTSLSLYFAGHIPVWVAEGYSAADGVLNPVAINQIVMASWMEWLSSGSSPTNIHTTYVEWVPVSERVSEWPASDYYYMHIISMQITVLVGAKSSGLCQFNYNCYCCCPLPIYHQLNQERSYS